MPVWAKKGTDKVYRTGDPRPGHWPDDAEWAQGTFEAEPLCLDERAVLTQKLTGNSKCDKC